MNREKVAAWREANPNLALTEKRLVDLLGTANLWDANLWGANLRGADLRDANLRDADLRGANLRGADLRDANLRDADLRGANMRGANLWDADLWGANLWDANLRGANLRGANLWDANLRGANLWGGLPLGTPSGSGYLVPTADGWRITIGCWRDKTLDHLRALTTGDDWPESTGAERERRRPILTALLALCEAHTEYHADKLAAVVEKWGVK